MPAPDIDTPVAARIQYTVSRADTMAALQETTQRMLRAVRWGAAMVWLMAATVACGIVIGMGYIELINGYIGRNRRLPWLIAVAFLGVWLLTIWQQRLRAARIHAHCADDGMAGPQALTMAADALVHETPRLTAHIAWPTLGAVVQFDNKLLIILINYSFIVVPFDAFGSVEQRDAWIAVLRARAPDGAWDASARTPAADALPAVTAATVTTATAFGVNENLRAGARLAFFRRVEQTDFVATAEAFLALVVLTLLLMLALGIGYVGVNGQLNVYELPNALLFVPLVLLFGVIAARAAENRALQLVMPVALVAASLVATLVCGVAAWLLSQKAVPVAPKYWQWIFHLQIAWWTAMVVVASWRFSPPPGRAGLHRTAGVALLGVSLVVAPGIWGPRGELWIPVEDPEAQHSQANKNRHALADEKGFYAQHDALQRALSALLPERPGIADVYSLTAGLYASEDVFMKEAMLIDALMRRRFDADGRSLVLLNNPATVHEYPLATVTSLFAALKHIGGVMNRDEDVLVLYVSSHGSEKHDLSVNFWPLRLQPVNPAALKQALDGSRIKWKVLVVSACYSGGFVEPLKDDNTLIITASSATKTSFGCGNESDATYLAKALFDEALRKTHSFETAFEQARKAILQREQARQQEPSDPRIFVGAAIREKLLQVEQRLSGLKP